MATGKHEPGLTDGDLGDRSGGTAAAGGASENVREWRRPVRALMGSDGPEVVDFGRPIPPALRDLSPGQQRIAAAIFAHLGLTASAGAMMVELQREHLRAQALRRSDDIETLTALVCLLIGHPCITVAEVADIHRAYQHLRQCHWWPSGPEDLPLSALLVAGSTNADQAITRIEKLHLALSEGDEVPGDPCALVVLCACVPEVLPQQVVLRFRALRTELLLSSIPVQDADITGLSALVTIAAEPDVVMREFVTERGIGLASSIIRLSSFDIALAADAVVLRHLSGANRLVFMASQVIRAWMAHRLLQYRQPSWFSGIRS